jgi:hypothetical protein
MKSRFIHRKSALDPDTPLKFVPDYDADPLM